jgi:hypothetical protein
VAALGTVLADQGLDVDVEGALRAVDTGWRFPEGRTG